MAYRFYGNEDCEVLAKKNDYGFEGNPKRLYDLLSLCWSKETCAPRLRGQWSKENMTLGQCSISSFLIQDIFGGEVRGVLLPDGAYHCYNVVDGKSFDLTSEQFGDEKLDYSSCPIQEREVHFSDPEKYARYLLLGALLKQRIAESK